MLLGLLALYNNISWFLKYLYPLRYEEYIVRYAAEYEVDPYLVAAVIKVESNFSPTAVSPKGAIGLMQLMPETARWAADQMGVRNFNGDLFNPELNIRIGTWYLSMLIKEFDGDTNMALAAYNGGTGNVKEWIKNGVLSRKRDVDLIPFGETRNFVYKVKRAYTWYKRLYKL
ncbi:lytic transglycosylase domain-containing protein [Thermosediminibacter oceani]|uniref:Lytic transglycosylase catalytic n=1 Tax=Thermosediminibacter oceani (strain ATCC BAA-1034 / DSM 16646 / JW/IW-1228P) TaxID=555079 RepID=D9RYG4_THEOJ|nr:lytic transglycosylase domain-containing protein [Thermosediminibacter oceani]ADL08388.1 Lytic transglycosylase catalytic [Thermosediminibacter oceani DSM 16646]